MLIVSLVFLQVLIFAGLIVMLRRMLTKNVVSATRHLDELNQDYTKKADEATRQLEEAKQKAGEIVAKAEEEAGTLKDRIFKEANHESDTIVKGARTKSEEIIQQADNARQFLLSEIDDRIAVEATNRACKLIQNTLPEKVKRDAHSRSVEDLIDGGFAQLGRLNIPPDIREIKITSAFGLDDAHRKVLAKKLKESLGHEITIKEEVDPELIAGFIINIGSLVLDGSLKNIIQEQAKDAKRTANE